MTTAMTTRERFHAVMNFQPFDRLPLVEWAGWWDKTVERWREEGLPVTDRYDMYRHFGMDVYYQAWVGSRRPGCPQAASHGAGIIASMADYERVRPFLFPEPELDPIWWRRIAAEQQRGEAVVWLTLEGFFWFPRTLFGIEPHLYAFYDQPEVMHRINQDLVAWQVKVIDAVCAYCTPDFMTFAEDLSYNHGPMLSKPLFEEFITPYYHQVIPRLKERGMLAIVDSDGDITEPASWFEAAGLDGILPLERQSGVDINLLRERYPRMLYIGHFDKMTMPLGEAAMRTEFERLLPAASRGGFIPSVDHQTPPGVSLANYEIYLRLFREYAARAACR